MKFDKNKFPSCFPENIPPVDSEYQNIKENVYRICKWGKIDIKAFMPTFVEDRMGWGKKYDKGSCGYYALSLYGDVNYLEKMLRNFFRYTPEAIIAVGKIVAKYGPSSREYDPNKKAGKSHINWWLHKDAAPHEEFSRY